MMFLDALRNVPTRASEDTVNVFVETPTGSRDKFDLDHECGLFRWSMQLPIGMAFPFSFGFVPNTIAEDGDPLDIALLVDGVFPQGTLCEARLVGVLAMTQDESGDGDAATRNDRILAVPTMARSYGDVKDLGDLRADYCEEIADFFRSYNKLIGRSMESGEPLGREEADRRLVEAIERYERSAENETRG